MGISDKEKGPFKDPSLAIEGDCPPGRGKLIPFPVRRGFKTNLLSAPVVEGGKEAAQIELTEAIRAEIDALIKDFDLDEDQVIINPETGKCNIRIEGRVLTVREYVNFLLVEKKTSSIPLKYVPGWTTLKK